MSKKNKLVPVYKHLTEKNSPVPMQSRVAFKKPLSAHERVLRALKTHDALKRLEAQPGDESFDGPNYDELTPHQLVVDEISGNEMTAGELHMLETERAQARVDVNAAHRKAQAAKMQREAAKARKLAQKKVAAPPPDDNLDEVVENDSD